MKRLARTITHTNADIQNITFRNANHLEAWIQPNRKPGRPRNKLTNTAMEEMWTEIIKQKTQLRHIPYDITNNTIIAELKLSLIHI